MTSKFASVFINFGNFRPTITYLVFFAVVQNYTLPFLSLLYKLRLVCYTNRQVSPMTNLVTATKSVLRRTPAFWVYEQYLYRKSMREWVREGKPLPPPNLIKQHVVKEYAGRFHMHVFVETGTYLGEMVNAVKDVFDQIYSIELSMELYQNAKIRFAGIKHVTIIQGDSGEVLDEVLAHVNQPCLFWLDGHYSEGITVKSELETPIRKELSHIFGHSIASRHVILIDDARCFTSEHDYPTIEQLRDISKLAGFDSFEVKNDIIRIHKLASFSK